MQYLNSELVINIILVMSLISILGCIIIKMFGHKLNFIVNFVVSLKDILLYRLLAIGILGISFYFSFELFKDLFPKWVSVICAISFVFAEIVLAKKTIISIKRKEIGKSVLWSSMFLIVFGVNVLASTMNITNELNRIKNIATKNSTEYKTEQKQKDNEMEFISSISTEIKQNKKIDSEKINKAVEENAEVINQKAKIENEKNKLNNLRESLRPVMIDSKIENSSQMREQKNIIENEKNKLVTLKSEIKTQEEKNIVKNNISNETITKTLDFLEKKRKTKETNISSVYIEKGFESFLADIVNYINKDENNEETTKTVLRIFSCVVGVLLEFIGIGFGIIEPKTFFNKTIEEKPVVLEKSNLEKTKVLEKLEKIKEVVPIIKTKVVIQKEKPEKKYNLEEYLQFRKNNNLTNNTKLKEICVEILDKYNIVVQPNVLGKQLKTLGINPIKKVNGSPIYNI